MADVVLTANTDLSPIIRAEYDRIIAPIRAGLDRAAFVAAWAEGQQMTLEQAIAEALGESPIDNDDPWL